MADFAPALAKTLEHEGGLFHKPSTGEWANFGITVWFLRAEGRFAAAGRNVAAGAGEIAYLRAMTREDAAGIYRDCFWDRYSIGAIADQALAEKVFDMTVNMGAGGRSRDGAVSLLQKAVRQLGGRIEADGRLGPASLAAVNAADPRKLLPLYVAELSAHYRAIALADPRHADDLKGWLGRASQ